MELQDSCQPHVRESSGGHQELTPAPPQAEPLPHGSNSPENASFPPGCCMTPSQLGGHRVEGDFIFNSISEPPPLLPHTGSPSPQPGGFWCGPGAGRESCHCSAPRGSLPRAPGSVPRVPGC